MSLVSHAEEELRRAGLFDSDSDYGGALGDAVLALVRLFASQSHSGFSALTVISLFEKLARFQPLTPLTADPSEWIDHGDGLWQSRRQANAFSKDGGQTWYTV